MKYMDYILETLERIVNTPSPSGCTKEVMEIIRREAENFGFQTEFNRKGGLIITVPGQTEHVLGFSAHVDTLGSMVRSVRSNGTLALTQIGGMMMEAIEGSYCQILTRDGRRFTGTIQTKEPSVHVWDDCKEFKRTEENMEVRLDEIVRTKEDVEQLGIGAGDFISFDPKFVITESGFVKSRHMDDKASAAVLLGLLKYVHDTGKKPEQTLKLLISNYEEVGHGCSYIPQDVEELIAVDMGCVGDDLNGDEYRVSICAKDSRGPYDFDMTNRLIGLAKEYGIGYTVDVFPHYGSDVSAALAGGNNIRGALIGQGVSASHGQERTHVKGLMETFKLAAAYAGLLNKEEAETVFADFKGVQALDSEKSGR